MTTYDFIFSNRLPNRVSRHIIFWVWSYAFMLLTFQIFAYANTEMGLWERIHGFITSKNQRPLIGYTRPVFIQIIFAYSIIYILIPRFINRKNWVITIAMCLVLLAIVFAATWLSAYITSASAVKSGNRPHMASNAYLTANSLRIVLFVYPTSAGLAIAIKLLKRWWLKQKEAEQVAKEKARAELQLLKAQIHPHFLFNSLNNIYSFTLEGSPKASEMIQKLSGLLHYMLHGCKQPLVSLEKEIEMIQDYISLEKIRYGDRLKLNLHIQLDNIREEQIAPLLLIPFVENSFKHGTSKMLAHPEVSLNMTTHEGILYFKLMNTKPTGIEEISVNGNRGIGLKNVKKRLDLLYPGRYELQILEEPFSFSIWLKIILTETIITKKKVPAKKEEPAYEFE